MSFSPYLFFDGTCREAMSHYAKIFGTADPQFTTYAEAPPGASPPGNPGERIMHSFLMLDAVPLMGSDTPKGMFKPQQGVSVLHSAKDVATARARFDALAEGGEVIMPFAPTFWSDGFGMLKDRYGTHWMITHAPKA